jgi:LmbE family N-acetylglucosaminyl deacetylase
MFRLLCVTAHPDDEAASFGGSLLLYHERGVETYITCLTPGTAATHRGGAKTDEELAGLRRKEFAAACEHLNVTGCEVLDFPDGKLDRADFYEMVGVVVRRIREIRPHVMLTTGPEGGVTGHPDHSMAGIAATLAFHWASRSNRFTDQFPIGLQAHQTQKLYYCTNDFTLPDRQPVALPPASATIEIGMERHERKIEAFKKHTSQSPLFDLFETHTRKREGVELFHLAAWSEMKPMACETDLLEGVREH